MSCHTPGPWTLEYDPGQRIRVRTSPTVCYAFSLRDAGNAQLIAAAPDMLEALRDMLKMHDGTPWTAAQREGFMDAVRAAIAKAEG